jgi:FMN phosphatase YigB (HAD superfamily)
MNEKLVIFDFDNTLANMNVNKEFFLTEINQILGTITFKFDNLLKKSTTIDILPNIFNDYNNLYSSLMNLKKKGYNFSIASFGNYYVIKNIVDKAFPDIFDFIITPENIEELAKIFLNKDVVFKSRKIVDDKCDNGVGKNIMIELLSNLYNIKYKNIYFFDDDENNFYCAKKFLNIKGVNNPKSGITVSILNKNLL